MRGSRGHSVCGRLLPAPARVVAELEGPGLPRELLVMLHLLRIERARLHGRPHRAAGLRLVTAVAVPAAGGERRDVREGHVEPVLVG